VIRLAVAAVAFYGTALAPVPPVIVRDPGPGPVGHYLAMTLAKIDTRVLMGDTLAITKDSVFPGAVVILAKQVTVTALSEIKGDLIVVGGDLFIKPGTRIYGQAVAIGGGVYASFLASARDGKASYRDFTFDAERVNGAIELRYHDLSVVPPESAVQLPGVYGLRMPAYDRSNGLSIPGGPTIALDGGKLTVDPIVTYRSQIGQVDPSLTANWQTGRNFLLHGAAARETRSNDAWITGDLSNSLNALLIGRDTRNWYRANLVQTTANRTFETPAVVATYRLGGQFERASSARPDSSPTSGPWSFIGKHSTEGMRRPNPPVPAGDIGSVLAGANYKWNATAVTSTLDVGLEVPVSSSLTNAHFVQMTVDGQVSFPTFGIQRFRFDAHAILTRGDTAPLQRFGYLGGSGTLATVEPLLSLGGDELLFLESRYIIPVPAITLPFVGSPTVTLRHIVGTAAIQHLPALTQNVGIRLSVLLVRGDLLMDTKTRKVEIHTGLSLVR
jgi:hypothetical protein